MFQHLDRLAKWQSGRLPPPITVELDLTNACNHACPGCTFSYLVNYDKSSIPFDLAKKTIKDLGEFGVKAITFSGGGEPLVYGEGRVLELMEYAKSFDMDVALITNGSLLTPDSRYFELTEWVRISLDAYDAETFKKYHGRGEKEFDKVVDRIYQFCSEKIRRKDAGLRTPTIGLGFLTNRSVICGDDFRKMSEFSSKFRGLDYVQFRPLVVNMVEDPTLGGGEWWDFSEDEYEKTNKLYQEAATEFDRDDFKVLWSGGKYQSLSQPNFGRSYNRCHGHFLEAAIGADCGVYICCHGQGQDGFKLGDLRENSFSEIWHSKRAAEVYESINPMVTCPPSCRLHSQNALLETIKCGTTHANFI